MPVAQGRRAPAPQAILVGLGALMAVVTVLFLVTQMDRLLGEADDIGLDIGDSTFRPGNVDDLADSIDSDGPLFFSDLAGGDRDIWLQHTGDADDEGWVALGVRPLASPRDCFAEWRPDEEVFVDNCDGTEYPAGGDGLPRYPVAVDDDGELSVFLDATPTVGGEPTAPSTPLHEDLER
jgi:hypothetical protein